MRDIKFRAWDNKDKKMITRFDGISHLGDNGGNKINPALMLCIGGYHWCIANWGVDVTLMQFTGLHDKNGKETYVSDLIKDHNGRLFECKMSEEYLEVYFQEIGSGVSLTPYGLLLKGGKFEIVGNIYEQPELTTSPTGE